MCKTLCLSPIIPFRIQLSGEFLEVQWLGLDTFIVVNWVQSLVREIKFHGMAKKKKKKARKVIRNRMT